ncbi:hypothetical protein F5Y01DRAFT_119973 [Xylaria sp. FL0043]|nr:hypothetical protein F5Y01DRAFT_119973 [Xylaria sp. FL0043]
MRCTARFCQSYTYQKGWMDRGVNQPNNVGQDISRVVSSRQRVCALLAYSLRYVPCMLLSMRDIGKVGYIWFCFWIGQVFPIDTIPRKKPWPCYPRDAIYGGGVQRRGVLLAHLNWVFDPPCGTHHLYPLPFIITILRNNNRLSPHVVEHSLRSRSLLEFSYWISFTYILRHHLIPPLRSENGRQNSALPAPALHFGVEAFAEYISTTRGDLPRGQNIRVGEVGHPTSIESSVSSGHQPSGSLPLTWI